MGEIEPLTEEPSSEGYWVGLPFSANGFGRKIGPNLPLAVQVAAESLQSYWFLGKRALRLTWAPSAADTLKSFDRFAFKPKN